MHHNPQQHRIHRAAWLRAAVLGANDGIISTASLVLGVAASGADTQSMLIAGIAGLVAGSMSMAAGEYVSVSSQADVEHADLELEKQHIAENFIAEHEELVTIYQKRGLDRVLASQVATQLMEHDALGAHAHDELGISKTLKARPVQAAIASAISFATGAALPLFMIAIIFPSLQVSMRMGILAASSLIFLALLGFIAARIGGAPVFKSILRVTLLGALAMALTSLIGSLFGVTSV